MGSDTARTRTKRPLSAPIARRRSSDSGMRPRNNFPSRPAGVSVQRQVLFSKGIRLDQRRRHGHRSFRLCATKQMERSGLGSGTGQDPRPRLLVLFRARALHSRQAAELACGTRRRNRARIRYSKSGVDGGRSCARRCDVVLLGELCEERQSKRTRASCVAGHSNGSTRPDDDTGAEGRGGADARLWARDLVRLRCDTSFRRAGEVINRIVACGIPGTSGMQKSSPVAAPPSLIHGQNQKIASNKSTTYP